MKPVSWQSNRDAIFHRFIISGYFLQIVDGIAEGAYPQFLLTEMTRDPQYWLRVHPYLEYVYPDLFGPEWCPTCRRLFH